MNKRKLTKPLKSPIRPSRSERLQKKSDLASIPLDKQEKKYILSKTKFGKWNRWYFKIRLLRHFKATPLSMKKTTNQEVQQLKKQLLEAQALNEKLQLKNMALETMVTIAEKELSIDIRWSLVLNSSRNKQRLSFNRDRQALWTVW